MLASHSIPMARSRGGAQRDHPRMKNAKRGMQDPRGELLPEARLAAILREREAPSTIVAQSIAGGALRTPIVVN
jgi:hypothetical protein